VGSHSYGAHSDPGGDKAPLGYMERSPAATGRDPTLGSAGYNAFWFVDRLNDSRIFTLVTAAEGHLMYKDTRPNISVFFLTLAGRCITSDLITSNEMSLGKVRRQSFKPPGDPN
jgi:hypothetical protein